MILHPNWNIAGFNWSYAGFSRVLQVFPNLPHLPTPRIGPDIHAGSRLHEPSNVRYKSKKICSEIRLFVVLIVSLGEGGLIHLQID